MSSPSSSLLVATRCSDAKVISRDAGLAHVASPAARWRFFGMGMGQKWILPGLVNVNQKPWKDPAFFIGKSTISMATIMGVNTSYY